jgi:hypothetical protein
LVSLLKRKKFLSWDILPFIGIAVLLLLHGKTLFFSLTSLSDGYEAVIQTFKESAAEQSDRQGGFFGFMANFCFPVHSLDAAFNKNYQLRLFVDWLYAFASFIPEKIFSNVKIPESISYYNTRYLVGVNDDYEIPTGLLAFGIYSLSWPGLFLVCYIYGWFGRFCQTLWNQNFDTLAWMKFIYVMTIQVWLDILLYGDPQVYIRAHLWFFMSTFLVLFWSCKISVIKPSQSLNI